MMAASHFIGSKMEIGIFMEAAIRIESEGFFDQGINMAVDSYLF